MTAHTDEVGLSGVAGLLAPRRHDLSELAAAGLLTSSTEALTAFGFERAHICDPDYLPEEMALDAARAALGDAGLQPHEVDVVMWASARPEGHVRTGSGPSRFAGSDPMRSFRYTSAWLQDVLGLHNAEVMAVAQQGCSTMFAALRVARSLLMAEPGRQHVLCVGVDVLPPGRPAKSSTTSSAMLRVPSSFPADVFRRSGLDSAKSRAATTATPPRAARRSWLPTFRQPNWSSTSCSREHGLAPGDIDVVVPTGVSRFELGHSAAARGISSDRLHVGLPSFGHTIIADSFLYLGELRRLGQVPRGSRLLLFTYGFGSSWCGLLLEH